MKYEDRELGFPSADHFQVFLIFMIKTDIQFNLVNINEKT